MSEENLNSQKNPQNLPREILFKYTAILILADGKFYLGQGCGREGEALGEICFNTSMTGYQEILTDPSYSGQIINFTFPHIGNVGTNDDDAESRKVFASGLVMREQITNPSNFRNKKSLEPWIKENNLVGIYGVDTRALTRYIRNNGAQAALIYHNPKGLQDADLKGLTAKVAATPDLTGLDLASKVTTEKNYDWNTPLWQLETGYQPKAGKYKVVAIDYGEKLNILRCLSEVECNVTVVGAKASAKEILALKPDGIFLSNGPADPAATFEYAGPILKELIASGTPVFGICLGFQLMALAIGAKTQKMKQGHRGANHPVKNNETGTVEITSQNHGFEVLAETLPKNAAVTHVSLFDGCLEGFKLTDKPVFAVQYHPEASPGPHDSFYLFDNFVKMMDVKLSSEATSKKKAVVG